jgi:endonuclease G
VLGCTTESPDASHRGEPQTSAPASVPSPAPAVSTLASSPHVALGIPKDADDSDDLLMDERAYVVSYNPKREAANWVAWLDERDLGDTDRSGDFRADDRLPANVYHVTPGDYARSGFDRGHLCPSADRTDTAEDNSLTFLMSNMHPQRPELNRVTWKALEEHERGLAKEHHELYIVAGGIFDANPPTIGHGVAVPKADYKIIVVLAEGQGVESVTTSTEVIAVVMPNDPSAKERPWAAYATSVDEVERQSGYDFLSKVPEAVQKVIEAKTR